jgi:hypothetical protein
MQTEIRIEFDLHRSAIVSFVHASMNFSIASKITTQAFGAVFNNNSYNNAAFRTEEITRNTFDDIFPNDYHRKCKRVRAERLNEATRRIDWQISGHKIADLCVSRLDAEEINRVSRCIHSEFVRSVFISCCIHESIKMMNLSLAARLISCNACFHIIQTLHPKTKRIIGILLRHKKNN